MEDKCVAAKDGLSNFDLIDDVGFLECNYIVILLKGVWFKNMIHLIAIRSLTFCCH